ncbi:SMI1/KNR4 family protein [Capnocytophaga sp.]|uniref:SMI1/KNR4 family protein n=1 Tax=Capnocytophaga sp. TaxID=44737 RepID=UPI0026DD97AA|nr:SMI1/KNR4 family protein [Capnocytophaga sp.]MDO5105926.1 SMI1/KNR4 family protein [Capnocytophaga sp.]
MKNTIYYIGEKYPVNESDILQIEHTVNYELPADYKDFLSDYGYGNLNELLLFETPDADLIKNNFAEHLDLWKWDKSLQNKTLNSVCIAESTDGDVVVALDDKSLPYLLLPRHSEYPKSFATLWELVDWYKKEYRLEWLYFDSFYQNDWRFFRIEDDFLDLTLEKIAVLYKKFKKNYAVDAIFVKENYQPKCVLQNIGGWVHFNLDTGEIRFKFQKIFTPKAEEISRFLQQYAVITN